MISPTRNELLAQLVDYVALATSLSTDKIVRGNQNAPAPLGAYCSVLYVTDEAWGTSDIDTNAIVDDDTQLEYSIKGQRRYSFSVQFYRDNATDYAKLLMMFPSTPTGIEFEQTAYFVVRNIASVNQNAAVMSNNFEERATLNLDLIVNEIQTITINKVASVDMNLNFDGNSVIEETVEVS